MPTTPLTTPVTTAMTLRDRARGAVRDEVMKQAWRLFAAQGFEPTTVDQIAAAAGMSRRTFFRYFENKEDLVLERLLESGDAVAPALRERPADEPAWTALRRAFDSIVEVMEQHSVHSRPLQLMLHQEPALRSSVTELHRRWLDSLTPLVERHLPRRGGRRGPDVRAEAITSSALACLETARNAWAADPGVHLGALLDEVMGAVAPLE